MANSLDRVIVTGFEVFGAVVAVIELIWSVVSDTQTSHELNQIRNQLSFQMTAMERGFYNIERMIAELTDEVHDTAIRTQFKNSHTGIHDLKVAFNRFMNVPNQHTREDLVKECKANNMIRFAGYIQREILTSQRLSLKQLMLRRNDMSEFGNYCRQNNSIVGIEKRLVTLNQ